MWPFLKRNKKKKSFMRAYYTSAKFNINTTRLKLTNFTPKEEKDIPPQS